MNLYKTFKTESKTLNVYYDENAYSPRKDDNLTKIIAFHKRYDISDEHKYSSDDYNNFDKMKQAIIKEENVAIIEPLYAYDHSEFTISTTPFNDRWDSGQLGFVIITKEALREEYGIQRITKKYIEKANKILKA